MSYLLDPNGTIRRRKPISQRRRDGLISFGRDHTSQSGEDGIIQRLFDLIPPQKQCFYHRQDFQDRFEENRLCGDSRGSRWCVDVGAWDGVHLSNTFSLLCKSDKSKESDYTSTSINEDEHTWKGVLIEADVEKCKKLKELHDPLENICVNVTVSCNPNSTQSLSHILQKSAPVNFPQNFEVRVRDYLSTWHSFQQLQYQLYSCISLQSLL